MEKLTHQQQKLLQFIEETCEKEGSSPSYREIAKHFSFSSLGTVWRHIQTLKKKGVLQQSRYGARTLTTVTSTAEPSTSVHIPLLGRIKAGFPLETFPRPQEKALQWQWPKSSPDNAYLLEVKDSSFKEEMILPGDLLLIEGRQTALPGQMALILINQRESLIKRLWPEDEFIRLEASDASVRSLILRLESVQIQGVLLALIRSY